MLKKIVCIMVLMLSVIMTFAQDIGSETSVLYDVTFERKIDMLNLEGECYDSVLVRFDVGSVLDESVKVEYNREQSIYPQALVSYSIDAEGCGFEDLEKIYSKLCDIAQEKTASLNMDEIARKAKFVTIPGSDVMTLRFDIIPEVNIEQESASTVPTEENEDELCRRKIHR